MSLFQEGDLIAIKDFSRLFYNCGQSYCAVRGFLFDTPGKVLLNNAFIVTKVHDNLLAYSVTDTKTFKNYIFEERYLFSLLST